MLSLKYHVLPRRMKIFCAKICQLQDQKSTLMKSANVKFVSASKIIENNANEQRSLACSRCVNDAMSVERLLLRRSGQMSGFYWRIKCAQTGSLVQCKNSALHQKYKQRKTCCWHSLMLLRSPDSISWCNRMSVHGCEVQHGRFLYSVIIEKRDLHVNVVCYVVGVVTITSWIICVNLSNECTIQLARAQIPGHDRLAACINIIRRYMRG